MIYVIRISDTELKIGYTTDFEYRRFALKDKYGVFDVIGIAKGNRKKEQSIHRQLRDYRSRSPDREVYRISQEVVWVVQSLLRPIQEQDVIGLMMDQYLE